MISSYGRISGLLAFLVAACIAAGCASGAKPAPSPAPATPAQASSQATASNAGNFDPSKVTAEVKSATFVDVRSLIDSLNQIIRQQDYDSWLGYLTENYIKYYSDPVVLGQYSEYPVIKSKGIKLQTLHDYFVYVVYPSRQNDKIDDIEFVGENLVKAITISPKGDRNILYMLEKHGDAWKIGIGR
jgi:ABC-type transport system substrate-binding protein